MSKPTEEPRSLLSAVWSTSLEHAPDSGLIRVIASSPASPLITAIRTELSALAPAERPMVFALLHHARGADGELLTSLGDARILAARGGEELREQALIGGARLWIGRSLSARPAAKLAEGRFIDVAEAPAARDIALLTFDSAWALSAPSAKPRFAPPSLSSLVHRARGLFQSAERPQRGESAPDASS